MWITVMEWQLSELRQQAWTDIHDTLIDPINQKKYQLRTTDGAGLDIPEFPPPVIPTDVPPEAVTFTVKNSWNTESAAQEFANFITNLSRHVTVTIEQVG